MRVASFDATCSCGLGFGLHFRLHLFQNDKFGLKSLGGGHQDLWVQDIFLGGLGFLIRVASFYAT